MWRTPSCCSVLSRRQVAFAITLPPVFLAPILEVDSRRHGRPASTTATPHQSTTHQPTSLPSLLRRKTDPFVSNVTKFEPLLTRLRLISQTILKPNEQDQILESKYVVALELAVVLHKSSERPVDMEMQITRMEKLAHYYLSLVTLRNSNYIKYQAFQAATELLLDMHQLVTNFKRQGYTTRSGLVKRAVTNLYNRSVSLVTKFLNHGSSLRTTVVSKESPIGKFVKFCTQSGQPVSVLMTDIHSRHYRLDNDLYLDSWRSLLQHKILDTESIISLCDILPSYISYFSEEEKHEVKKLLDQSLGLLLKASPCHAATCLKLEEAVHEAGLCRDDRSWIRRIQAIGIETRHECNPDMSKLEIRLRQELKERNESNERGMNPYLIACVFRTLSKVSSNKRQCQNIVATLAPLLDLEHPQAFSVLRRGYYSEDCISSDQGPESSASLVLTKAQRLCTSISRTRNFHDAIHSCRLLLQLKLSNTTGQLDQANEALLKRQGTGINSLCRMVLPRTYSDDQDQSLKTLLDFIEQVTLTFQHLPLEFFTRDLIELTNRIVIWKSNAHASGHCWFFEGPIGLLRIVNIRLHISSLRQSSISIKSSTYPLFRPRWRRQLIGHLILGPTFLTRCQVRDRMLPFFQLLSIESPLYYNTFKRDLRELATQTKRCCAFDKQIWNELDGILQATNGGECRDWIPNVEGWNLESLTRGVVTDKLVDALLSNELRIKNELISLSTPQMDFVALLDQSFQKETTVQSESINHQLDLDLRYNPTLFQSAHTSRTISSSKVDDLMMTHRGGLISSFDVASQNFIDQSLLFALSAMLAESLETFWKSKVVKPLQQVERETVKVERRGSD